MKRTTTCILAVAVVGVLCSAGPPRDPLPQVLAELRLLHSRVVKLEERVARLEGRGVAVAPVQQGRVMRVEGVETLPRDVDASDRAATRAAQLRREAEALEEKARKKDEEVARNRAQKVPWPYDRDRKNTWEYEQKQARKALRLLALEYRQEAQKKTGEAIRLDKKAEEVRQVIRGWDGTKTVTLETVRDMSGRLRGLTPQSCLKWTGTLVRSDAVEEVWSVTTIEIVACPAKLGAP